MILKIIEFSARNRFVVLVLILILLIWGVWALRKTPLDALPDLGDTQVIIYTDWAGRSPDLVEDQITYPISSTLLAAPKVQAVRGFSFLGSSFIYVIFQEGTDIYWARSRVLEYLQAARSKIPADVNPILGPDATGLGWGFCYALVDEGGQSNLAELRSLQDWSLKLALESVPGVAQVASVGGFVKQYQVTIDPHQLLAYNIPISRAVEAIRRSNRDIEGRVLDFSGFEYTVRGRGYIKSIKDLENIPVGADANGTPVLLRAVAKIQLGPEIRRGLADLDGKGEVVGGIVVIRFGENVLDVISRVKERINKDVAPGLPQGVKVVTTYDRSDLVRSSIKTLRDEILKLLVAVSAVCLVFLFHLPSALVILLTLPLAILISFICMYYLGVTSNIMSLGGIAIAIGVMVDASIVMTENAHKKLEEWEESGRNGNRTEVLIAAAREVGPSLFFSLLVITAAFLPVFALHGQSGKLFTPLAYTKTFAMLFSSFLAITLTPALLTLFVHGKVRSEEKNPVSRFLRALYGPLAAFALKHPAGVILLAVVFMAGSVYPFLKLGQEFMPPLYEGSLFYMPVTVPGISVSEAGKILQAQDRILKGIPEVAQVFGKAGRAETATDPAPLEMFETVINLKPESEWRPGMTVSRLKNEMDEALSIPGVSNSFTMPIKARIDMLATGIRTPVGIKVLGPKLEGVEKLGLEVESRLRNVAGTRSVYADRLSTGYFLDIEVRREEAARYGLTVDDVQEVIQAAIGGTNITTTVEGRERYPVNLRYPRDLRGDVEALKRVVIPVPASTLRGGGEGAAAAAQVPLAELAEIRAAKGPTQIKSEEGLPVSYVYIDAGDRDVGGYIADAEKKLAGLKIPEGYRLQWSGDYEYLQSTWETLKIVLPLTALIILLLLYLNTRSLAKTAIVLLAVPFSLIGSFWLLYFLNYNLSVAVLVGLIALAGLDAETGIVMLLYLDLAYEKWKREGRLKTPEDLKEAILHGAVKRIRPKIMTVGTTFFGLLPILFSAGTGADVMKRIAAPMVGGLITSALLELLIYPAIYFLLKRKEVEKRGDDADSPASVVPKS
jgi:Cu(I)/Ag(I) efflux system membrane protein CusA/SilA